MKLYKRTSLLSLAALAFVCAGAFGVARADTRDVRVVSARAGGVNLVSGDVKVRRAASADWLALSTQDELKSGDTVRTGPTGRVEVLLNPGSYFRAGGSTEFTLASADLNDLLVELARGSAVVEATGYSDMNLAIGVAVPGGLAVIERSGVYRFNVPAGGAPEVAVTKGRAVVAGTVVKGGKVARLSGAGVEVAKFDTKLRDELDLWSRDRGKELAKANERLSHRAVRSAFAMGGYDNLLWNSWGHNGFWFYNSALRCYTFLPFGYGWRSPYGHGYGLGVYRPRPDQSGRWVAPTVHQPSGGGTWGGQPNGNGGGGWGGAKSDGGGRVYTPAPAVPMTPRAEPMRPAPGMRPGKNQ